LEQQLTVVLQRWLRSEHRLETADRQAMEQVEAELVRRLERVPAAEIARRKRIAAEIAQVRSLLPQPACRPNTGGVAAAAGGSESTSGVGSVGHADDGSGKSDGSAVGLASDASASDASASDASASDASASDASVNDGPANDGGGGGAERQWVLAGGGVRAEAAALLGTLERSAAAIITGIPSGVAALVRSIVQLQAQLEQHKEALCVAVRDSARSFA
jgi:hypothetical protein